MADDPNKEDVKFVRIPRQSAENTVLSGRICTRFQQMKLGRQRQGDNLWNKWDQLYRNEPTSEPPEDWMANVFVPFVMSVELAILAEITDRRPRWKVLPQAPGDEEKADTIQAITDYTMDKGSWDDEFFKFTHDKIHYGTAVWKEVYREDRRVIREKVKLKNGKRKFKEKDIREFQDVYGHHVPLRDFYFDDRVVTEGIRGAEDCLERKIMRIELFRTRFSKYRRSKNVKAWGKMIKPELTDAEIKKFPPGGDTSPSAGFIPIEPLREDEVEVLDYWNKLNDEHVIVANGIVIVNEPNPYDHKQLPFAIDVAIPRPQSAYGIGIPQTLEPPQEELNTYHNMMIDEAKLNISKPTFMGGSSLIDEDEWQVRPKMIIPVDDVDQIKESTVGGPGVEAFRMFEEIKQTIRTAAGLDVRFAESTSPGGGVDTATEVLSLQEASLRRIGLYTKIMELRALPRIANLRTMNIMQYYSEPLRVEQILGKDNEVVLDEMTGKPKVRKVLRSIRFQKDGKSNFDFMDIEPEQIRAASVDIKVVPQSTQPLSQAVIAKRINTAMQTIMSFPPAIESVDVLELVKQFLKALDLPMSIAREVIKGEEGDDLELAAQENDALRKGEGIPATTNPSVKHTAIHASFIYKLDEQGRMQGGFTDTFKGLAPDAKQVFLKHYQGELSQHETKGTIAATGRARGVGSVGGTGTQTTTVGGEIATQEGV